MQKKWWNPWISCGETAAAPAVNAGARSTPTHLTRADASALRRVIGRIAREPFLHFLLLGGAMFVVGHHLEERSRFTRITITDDQILGMAANYRLQYGRTPSAQQLDALLDNYIREQIFYHEALKLGLGADDEIIRRRLVQKYEFLQQDLLPPTAPTDTQLRDYYRRNEDRYRRPETVTFTHVYFSPDVRGENGARHAAEELSPTLTRRGFVRAVERGDRFPGPYDFAALSREELVRVFGKEGLAESIFDIEPNNWSAPLRSGLGWHTVYVSAHDPARQPTFEEVREDVRRDYIDAERRRRNAETFAKLRERFRVSRE